MRIKLNASYPCSAVIRPHSRYNFRHRAYAPDRPLTHKYRLPYQTLHRMFADDNQLVVA